jgi:S1-C subfamily serine protease
VRAATPKNLVGTGFIAAPSGLIVTADHVIIDKAGKLHRDIWALQPVHPNAIFYKLKVVKRFRDGQNGRDLAILKSDKQISAPGLWIGGPVEPGDPIVLGVAAWCIHESSIRI